MILYFDSKGQLREEISEYILQDALGNTISTSFITTDGNISANKIFALFEGETPTKAQAYITYRMPNGNIYSNASIECDAVTEASIAYNAHRDLKMFKYGKIYRFMQFNLPSALLTTGGAGVYQVNITLYPDSATAKSYPQFSFKAEGTPANLVVNEITDTQYSLIMAKIANIEASVDNFVPYSGATDNVNLGTHRIEANDVRASSSGHTIDLAIGADGKPHFSYDTGQKIFFLPIDGATGTLATQGWVNGQNFVPFEENGDVDIGEHRLTTGQVSIEEGRVSALFNLQQNGTLEIVNYDDNGYEFIFEFPIDGEEEDTYHIATREWVKGLLTPSAVGTGTLTKANVNGYNGAEFTIGTTNNAGLYVFTYGNCMVLLPVAGLTAGTEYKVASVLVGSGDAGFQTKVLTYRLTSEGVLQIYQKQDFIPTGWGAFLMKIALYS